MPLSPAQQKTIEAIRAGKATSMDALAKALGTDRKGASNAIGAVRRAGAVTYKMIHPRAIDWSTIRVVGRDPKHDKPIKARAVSPSAAKRSRRRVVRDERPAPEPAVPTTTIVGSTALLLNTDDIARIRTLVGQARAACDELETLAATAEKSPTIGKLLRTAVERLIPETAPVSALGLWADGAVANVSAPAKAARTARAPRKPAARPAAGGPARKPRTKAATDDASDESADVTPSFRIVNRLGEELATFCERDAAERGFAASKWATALVDIATGETLKTKGTPMKTERIRAAKPASTLALAHDEEE